MKTTIICIQTVANINQDPTFIAHKRQTQVIGKYQRWIVHWLALDQAGTTEETQKGWSYKWNSYPCWRKIETVTNLLLSKPESLQAFWIASTLFSVCVALGSFLSTCKAVAYVTWVWVPGTAESVSVEMLIAKSFRVHGHIYICSCLYILNIYIFVFYYTISNHAFIIVFDGVIHID